MSQKTKVDTRIPAHELLIKFIQDNKMSCFLSEVSLTNEDVKGVLFTTYTKPMLRVFYQDQIKKKQLNGENKPKVEIVN